MNYTFTLPTVETEAAIEEFIQNNGLKDVVLRVRKVSKITDNYVGEIFKIEIASKHDKFILHNLIVKTILNKTKFELMKLENLFNLEAVFYNVVVPIFEKFQNKHNIPVGEQFDFVKCHKADKNLMLMENMCVRGYRMHDWSIPYDSDHLELALISLARYHSISFAMKKLNLALYKNLAKLLEITAVVEDEVLDMMIEYSLMQATKIMGDVSRTEKMLSFSKNAVDKYHKLTCSESAKPYDVICHRDCWNNNFLFKYENGIPVDMKFVGWQFVEVCSPIIDLAHMIYLSTDASMRANYKNRLFNIYYDALGKQLTYFGCDIKECYPLPIFYNHVKEFLPYGLMISTVALPHILSNIKEEIKFLDDYEAGKIKYIYLQYNEKSKDRIRGIVDDFIKLKLI
ncbi:uncharacterized protein LOC143917874 [Arctopsyche grandis]|uniref:uncharacterized protein LOC143917874 n=1 Tax=Arctopsyche grandis TaxID=121162 RepID=UPI00406D7AC5